jgi:predicted nucleic acid-binding protein
METVVVDTSVLVRIFDKAETGHSPAALLGQHFVKYGIRVRFPYHALFELSATLKRKSMDGKLDPFKGITEDDPLLVQPIAIDEKFFRKYFDPTLPCLKAGDLLFVAMAKGDGSLLITEDTQQYAAAKTIGIEVFRIDEYLSNKGS